MRLRNLVLASCIAVLAPAMLLAADTPASKAKAPCDKLTGTRIKPTPSRACPTPALPLRSFSQEEILRTGEINLAEALRKLDPTFR